MALADILTDGTDEVNLATATRGFADTYTYRQQVARKNALGEYPDVTERWQPNWHATDDDERGTVHAKLMRLQRKAQKWYSGDFREGPVWRETQTPTERMRRYAVVTDLEIPELDPYFYGPSEAFRNVTMTVTREGAWRLVSPIEAWRELVSSETVYDYNESGTVNWITFDPGGGSNQLPGDADALVKLTIDVGTYDYESDNQVTIAKRTADTEAELNGFVPHFNPNEIDNTNASPSFPVDATCPTGYRMDVANSTGTEKTWYFEWGYDPDYYQGEYLMIVPIKMVGASDYMWISALHDDASFGANRIQYEEVYVPAGFNSVYQKVFVARITLPHQGYLPASETFPPVYYTGFFLRMPDGVSCQIRNWWLVPINEGLFSVRGIGNDFGSFPTSPIMIIDGSLQKTYLQQIAASVEPGGRYLTADHQKYTRFYFYKSYEYDDGSDNKIDAIKEGKTSMTVTADVIPRVKALVTP